VCNIQGGSKKVSCCTVSTAYFFEPPCRRSWGVGGALLGGASASPGRKLEILGGFKLGVEGSKVHRSPRAIIFFCGGVYGRANVGGSV